MGEKVKGFRIDEITLQAFEKLKEDNHISSDSDMFRKLVFETTFISSEALQEKDKELKALYIKLGELQGELNIYKQQALPRKSFWKRIFGG